MDKKHKQHLLVTIIFAMIVSATLFFMYDDFVFQTYGEVVYYDYILAGESEQVKVENLEVYCDQEKFYLGDGRIIFKDTKLVGQKKPVIKMTLSDDKDKLDHAFTIDDYSSDNLIYSFKELSKKGKKVKLSDIKTVTLTIEVAGNNVDELNLKITPLDQLEGSSKEYRIENASISDSMMRLGSLKTSNSSMFKEYPNVSLEYRYLKDKSKDKEDNDNYVVFKKISGTSKELVNSNDYGTYNLDDEDESFKDKDLSVVIIFSNDKDKFAFAIDLKIREVGDYYG